MPPTRDLDAILARMLGPAARYRPGQREAIESVLQDGARVVVVQATGWGKSIVYWIATRVRRDEGHGPTLIISPLLALMRNQIEMARRIGLRAATVNSGNVEEWEEVRTGLIRGDIDVLLVSPERLGNERFLRDFLPSIEGSLGLFVVDEVHCISDWGHDFRPDYRRIGAILQELPVAVPVLGTTATANERVLADVAAQLGHDARVIAGPLRRTSLRLGAFRMRDQSERLAWLAQHLPAIPGSGIVYCLTIADTERVADWLRARGIDAMAYHAGLEPDARTALEDDLLANRVRVLVATVALGMGFDKPDLAFVIHFQRPGSVVAYYQQVGRAGRALPDAWGVLLSGREDDEIAEFFINQAFPPVAQQRAIVDALTARAQTPTELEQAVDLPRGRIAAILKVLEVDGAVARAGSRFRRTGQAWEPDVERIASVTAQRRAELAEMRAYVDHGGCLMRFLSEALDDRDTGDCGRCATEDPVYLPRAVHPALVREAIAWLRGRPVAIEPRRMWPADAVPGLKGRIALPAEPGLALALEGDAGWGRAVAAGLREGAIPADALDAAADLARSRWFPKRAAGWWVTSIPSPDDPTLEDAARAIAERLGLPFRAGVLAARAAAGSAPATGANSVRQLRAASDRLTLRDEPPAGPVLLVDSRVASRWTMSLAGHLLRQAGAGPVHPFAFLQSLGGAEDG
ncbi:MAG: RecQ family ATP-dependent DNA helicase [Chloroflexota bacterium]